MRIANMLNVDSNSEFPKFDDADVIINLGNGRIYGLHANVLRRNSSFFNTHLTEDNAAELSSKAKKEGVMTRYRVDLTDVTGPNVVGVLNFREVDSNGRSLGSLQLPMVENGKAVNPIYKHYDNLFKAYYNLAQEIDDTNIATILSDCMGLVDVAEYLGSISVIQQTVDINLLRQGQVLFRSIQQNAPAWSDLAYRVRSPVMLTESVIHLVGQWNMMNIATKDGLNPEVRKMCETKVAEMDKIKMAIELRIFGHYPLVVQRVAADRNGRSGYAGQIYMWMCISLFRQWFGQSIAEGRGRINTDGGAHLYRQLSDPGSYLNRNALAGFHQYFPMSPKAMAVVENTLGSLKEELKPMVEELLVNRSQMEINEHNKPSYLTCCVIKKTDLPWINEGLKKAKKERRDTLMGGMDRSYDGFGDVDMIRTDPVERERAATHSTSGAHDDSAPSTASI